MKRLNTEILARRYDAPLDLVDNRVTVEVSRVGNFTIYQIEYNMSATDSHDRKVFRADLVMELLLRHESLDKVNDDDLMSFASTGVGGIAHPYVREIMHSVGGRMGMPPLILDFGPPTPSQILRK